MELSQARTWCTQNLGIAALSILKYHYIRQPNGHERIDLWTWPDTRNTVLRELKRAAVALNVPITARHHKPFAARQRHTGKARLRIATWNVSTLRGRRGVVRNWLARYKPDVLILTETQLKATDPNFRVEGYRTFPMWATGTIRGMMILIADWIHARWATGVKDREHSVWVQADLGRENALPLLLGGVYLSPSLSVEARTSAIRKITTTGMTHTGNRRGYVIAAGDWNTDQDKLHRELRGTNCTVLDKQADSGGTYCWMTRDAVRSSDLDHVVIENGLGNTTVRCRVDSLMTSSDHRPVLCDIAIADLPKRPPTLRRTGQQVVDRRRLVELAPETAEQIAKDGSWDGAHRQDITLAEAAQATDRLLRRQLQRHKLLKRTTSRRRRYFPEDRKHARATQERGAKYGELVRTLARQKGKTTAEAAEARREAMSRWLTARLKATDLGRIATVAHGRGYTEWLLERTMRPDKLRQIWAFAREMGDRGRSNLPKGLVLRADGTLAKTPKESAEARREFYAAGARDTEALHSSATCANAAYWRARLAAWRAHGQTAGWQAPDRRDLSALLAQLTFTAEDLIEELRRSAYGKASGLEGLPVGALKATIQRAENAKEDPRSPPLPQTRHLTWLLSECLRTGTVPQIPDWTHSRCISIYKRGDSRQPSNYRPISLIHPSLKLLLAFLARRIAEQLEVWGRLGPWQAGFRPRHSYAEQLLMLQEVTQRRTRLNRTTWVCFLDFSKAYDRVPQAAMLAKLHEIGVRGSVWELIRNLYETSQIVVEDTGARAPPFRLERGLRQGCPLSSVLFNVFASDMFDGCIQHGVMVPGLDTRLPGIAYADDTVLFAETEHGLRQSLQHVADWCKEFGMQLNASKCAIVVTGPRAPGQDPRVTIPHGCDHQTPQSGTGRTGNPGATTEEPEPVRFIHGDRKYKYLGLWVNARAELELDRTVATRWARITTLRMTRSRRVPACLRVLITRPMMESTALVGAEFQPLAGTGHLREAQRQTCRAYQGVLGLRASTTEYTTLRNEMGYRPLVAIARGRRVRHHLRALGSSIAVGMLTRNPADARRRRRLGDMTPMERTGDWLARKLVAGRHTDDLRLLVAGYRLTGTKPEHLLQESSGLSMFFKIAAGEQAILQAQRRGHKPIRTAAQAWVEYRDQAREAGMEMPDELLGSTTTVEGKATVWVNVAHIIGQRIGDREAEQLYRTRQRRGGHPQTAGPDHPSIRGRYSYWGYAETAREMWKPSMTLHVPSWTLTGLVRLRLDQYPLMTKMLRWGWTVPTGDTCVVCGKQPETIAHLMVECSG